MGITGPALGSRAKHILLDDPADKENTLTDYQRQHVQSIITEVIKPILIPGVSRIVLSGTRWHYDDLYGWAGRPPEEGGQGWATFLQKAIVTDEEGNESSYWEERFPLAWLVAEREKDRTAFARSYQNEVSPEEGITFERWWFQRRFDLLPDALVRYESWDLASSTGRKSDYSVGLANVVAPACPLCGGAPWHIFLPHMFRGKLGYGYLKMAMIDVYQMMGGYSQNHYVLVEKKNVGEALAGEGLQANGRVIRVYFRQAPGEGQGQGMKLKNIADVAEVCRQGRVHLPSDDFLARKTGSRQWLSDFERLLFSYEPEGHTDDVVSAFVQGILHAEELRMSAQRSLADPGYATWRNTVGPRRPAVA